MNVIDGLQKRFICAMECPASRPPNIRDSTRDLRLTYATLRVTLRLLSPKSLVFTEILTGLRLKTPERHPPNCLGSPTASNNASRCTDSSDTSQPWSSV